MTNKNIVSKIGFVALALFVLGAPVYANADQLYRQLEVGSRGSDVGSLQTFLSEDPSLYPQGLVTDYFGYLTKSAVSNFQVRNGLPGVGRVGPATLPVINAQMNGGNKTGTDRTRPAISNLNYEVTSSSATFNWHTDEGSAGVIYYSTGAIPMTEASINSSVFIGGNSFLTNTDLSTSHEGKITGLQSDTTYNYVIYVKDGSGNESITWPQTFRTNN